MQSWPASEWNCTAIWAVFRSYVTGQASPASGIISFLGRAHTQKQQSLTEPGALVLLLQQLENKPYSQQIGDSNRAKKPHLKSYTGCRYYHTNHTTYQGDNGQHTLEKTWLASVLKLALAAKILDIHSLHRDTVAQKLLFKTTVDNFLQNSQRQRKLIKMKNQRDYFQLKEQGNLLKD